MLESHRRHARFPPARGNLPGQIEDILELVGSGVEPITVADDYLSRFWANVMEGLTVRDDLVVREV